MKAVTLTIVEATASYHVINMEKDSPLTEDYCFTSVRVEENKRTAESTIRSK